MSGRWWSLAGMAVLVAAMIGCGKKAKKEDDTGTTAPAPTLPPQPGPGSVATRPTKEKPKVDFDVMLGDMKAFAGRKKTDTAPSGSTLLSQFTQAFPPGHARSADIYKAMIETADKLEVKDRPQYIYWAARYAGKENVKALLLIARNYTADPNTCSAAFTRLAELKEPSTFAEIASMLSLSTMPGVNTGLLSLESTRTLKAIGAPAEKAVLPYAGPTGPGGKANDFLLRNKAIEILGEIGTKESLPLLQTIQKDPNSTISAAAKMAIEAIRSRPM